MAMFIIFYPVILHIYIHKMTGLLLFFVPYCLDKTNDLIIYVVTIMAFLATSEELWIHLTSYQ